MDPNMECCMCGDVGFPDKLFRCARCLSRFQHSYCSNYCEESSSGSATICDWCRSEERKPIVNHPKKSTGKEPAVAARSDFPHGQKIKQGDGNDDSGGDSGGSGSGGPGKSSKGSSSGKPGGRRYKLLKDVLC